MAFGCYVIGEDVIHLKPPEVEKHSIASEEYTQLFINACKKLTEKLDCLVIVDPGPRRPDFSNEFYRIGKEYANSVYIIPEIVAVLQYTLSTTQSLCYNKILILIRTNELYYACSIMKQNDLQFYPYHIKTETIDDLGNAFYSDFTAVYCFHTNKVKGKQKDRLKSLFPAIKFSKIPSPMLTLAIGGFYKAQCVAEPGKRVEMLNFTLGIFNGNISVVKRCALFPLKVVYQPAIDVPIKFCDILTIVWKLKKGEWTLKWKIAMSSLILPGKSYIISYLFQYDKYGLLTIHEHALQLSFSIFNDFTFKHLKVVHVWSIEKQEIAIFNFAINERSVEPFDDAVKNLFTDEWLKSVDQTTTISEMSTDDTNLHTIIVTKKIHNYINGPRISIAPTYMGILQYYVSYFKPTTPIVIVIIITKNSSKIYALIQRSPLFYTVTYAAKYNPETFFDSIKGIDKKIKVLYIYEKEMDKPLQISFLSTKISITRHELTNIDDVAFYGGAIYALHNSSPTLISQYVRIDPLFDPEENSCDRLSAISKLTSSCFYVADAYFHCALKTVIDKNLFYGNLIAILIRRLSYVYIYFFVHVNNQFLFKFETTVDYTVLVDAALLHYADIVISESIQRPKFANDVIWTSFEWKKRDKIDEFLKDMHDGNLLVYDTPNYLNAVKKCKDNLEHVIFTKAFVSVKSNVSKDESLKDMKDDKLFISDTTSHSEAITNAKDNHALEDVIYEKTTMIIDCNGDKSRIVINDDQYLAINNGVWIPMYVSFSQPVVLVGNEAMKGLKKSPHSVIYDFVNRLSATSSTLSAISNLKWTFELIEMDNSDDPKLGYKVTTSDGCKIISPEMALTIYLQKLIRVYEKYMGKSVDEICIKISNTVLTEVQKQSFMEAAKRLKKCSIFC